MSRSLKIPLVAAAMAIMATSAAAQNCAMRTDVVARLQSGYDEQLTARGLQETRNSAGVIEIWSSPDSGTFTVLLTNAAGISCVVAAGTHFFPEEAKIAETPKGMPG